MMTRRITLTLAAAILTLVLIGVLIFAATGDDQATATATAAASAGDTDDHPTGGEGGPADDLDLTLDDVIELTANTDEKAIEWEFHQALGPRPPGGPTGQPNS